MRDERKAKRRQALLAALALLLVVSGATYAGVNAAAAKPDSQFQISPAGQSIEAGRTTTYAVTVTSTGGFAGTVGLSITGVPRGATANLAPTAPTLTASGAGSTAISVLSFTTRSTTVSGSSTFKVTGTSGKLNGLLAPGRTLPLQLSLTNLDTKSLSVRHLSVALHGVSRTSFAISHGQQCSLGDYAVIQFGGDSPLVMPGLATMTLSQLGVSADQWPQIQLSNRPVNQDGCKGATLSLSYSGSGQGV